MGAGWSDRQLRVLACDAEVKWVRRVSPASQSYLGGGVGTDTAAGIAQALLMQPRRSAVIVLTDGLTPWPTEPLRGARVIVALIWLGWGHPAPLAPTSPRFPLVGPHTPGGKCVVTLGSSRVG